MAKTYSIEQIKRWCKNGNKLIKYRNDYYHYQDFLERFITTKKCNKIPADEISFETVQNYINDISYRISCLEDVKENAKIYNDFPEAVNHYFEKISPEGRKEYLKHIGGFFFNSVLDREKIKALDEQLKTQSK